MSTLELIIFISSSATRLLSYVFLQWVRRLLDFESPYLGSSS